MKYFFFFILIMISACSHLGTFALKSSSQKGRICLLGEGKGRVTYYGKTLPFSYVSSFHGAQKEFFLFEISSPIIGQKNFKFPRGGEGQGNHFSPLVFDEKDGAKSDQKLMERAVYHSLSEIFYKLNNLGALEIFGAEFNVKNNLKDEVLVKIKVAHLVQEKQVESRGAYWGFLQIFLRWRVVTSFNYSKIEATSPGHKFNDDDFLILTLSIDQCI